MSILVLWENPLLPIEDRLQIAITEIERLRKLNESKETLYKIKENALLSIQMLDPQYDSDNGMNEWGEADCFRQAKKIASDALWTVNIATHQCSLERRSSKPIPAP